MFSKLVKRISHGVMVRVFTLMEVLGLPGPSKRREDSEAP